MNNTNTNGSNSATSVEGMKVSFASGEIPPQKRGRNRYPFFAKLAEDKDEKAYCVIENTGMDIKKFLQNLNSNARVAGKKLNLKFVTRNLGNNSVGVYKSGLQTIEKTPSPKKVGAKK